MFDIVQPGESTGTAFDSGYEFWCVNDVCSAAYATKRRKAYVITTPSACGVLLVTGPSVTAVYKAEGKWIATPVAKARDARKFLRCLMGDDPVACTCTILIPRDGATGENHATPDANYASNWARAATALAPS